MGLRKVEVGRYEKRDDEHVDWLKRRLYSKTPLTTFYTCPEKFRLRYLERAEERWGRDLIEGIAGHSGLELVHSHHAEKGEKAYPKDIMDAVRDSLRRLEPRFDSSAPFDVDAGLARIVPLVELYNERWKLWIKPETVEGVEVTWGADGKVEMGGAKVAGHIDLVSDLVLDFKFCGKTSSYRRPLRLDMGMEMYKVATKRKTAILPFIKDPFQKAMGEAHKAVAGGYVVIDALQPVNHTPATHRTAELLVANAVEQIEKGNVGGPPSEIGQGLCQRKYCDFFGRCRWTHHLPRNFADKEQA